MTIELRQRHVLSERPENAMIKQQQNSVIPLPLLARHCQHAAAGTKDKTDQGSALIAVQIVFEFSPFQRGRDTKQICLTTPVVRRSIPSDINSFFLFLPNVKTADSLKINAKQGEFYHYVPKIITH